ncbi:MAG: 30S ribosome-binding factor RbfA [Thermoanaerobacteraceae bacterium]
MQYRSGRLSEEVKREISKMILEEIKDPRIKGMVSITDINITKDLRYAKVYISIFGTDEEKIETMEGLKSASGFIRHEIGKRIKMRYTPEILFEIDHSIEYGAHISEVLKELKSQEGDNN